MAEEVVVTARLRDELSKGLEQMRTEVGTPGTAHHHRTAPPLITATATPRHRPTACADATSP